MTLLPSVDAQSQCGGLFGSRRLESGATDSRFLSPRGSEFGGYLFTYNFNAVAGEVWQFDAIAGDYDELSWSIYNDRGTLARGILDRRQTTDRFRIPQTGNYCLTIEHRWQRGNQVEYSFILTRLQVTAPTATLPPVMTREGTSIPLFTSTPRPTTGPTSTPRPTRTPVPTVNRTLSGEIDFNVPDGWNPANPATVGLGPLLETGFLLLPSVFLNVAETTISLYSPQAAPAPIPFDGEPYNLPEDEVVVAYAYASEEALIAVFTNYPEGISYDESDIEQVIQVIDETGFDLCLQSIEGRVVMGLAAWVSIFSGDPDRVATLECEIILGQQYSGSAMLLDFTSEDQDVLHLMAVIDLPSGDAVLIEILKTGQAFDETDHTELFGHMKTMAGSFGASR